MNHHLSHGRLIILLISLGFFLHTFCLSQCLGTDSGSLSLALGPDTFCLLDHGILLCLSNGLLRLSVFFTLILFRVSLGFLGQGLLLLLVLLCFGLALALGQAGSGSLFNGISVRIYFFVISASNACCCTSTSCLRSSASRSALAIWALTVAVWMVFCCSCF